MKRFELSTLSLRDALPLSYIRMCDALACLSDSSIMHYEGSLGQAGHAQGKCMVLIQSNK